MRWNGLWIWLLAALLSQTVARADIVPATPAPASKPKPAAGPVSNPRDPVAVAQKTPAIAEQLKKAREAVGGEVGQAGSTKPPAAGKPPAASEVVTKVPLGGQCGFAGCSSTTLIAFTYQSRGANPTTRAVLALVTCEAPSNLPCRAVPAEVRATATPLPEQ